MLRGHGLSGMIRAGKLGLLYGLLGTAWVRTEASRGFAAGSLIS